MHYTNVYYPTLRNIEYTIIRSYTVSDWTEQQKTTLKMRRIYDKLKHMRQKEEQF